MRRSRGLATAAVAVTVAVGLAACGGSSPSSTSSSSSSSGGAAVFNAGEKSVVNPSTKKGGTLRMAISDDWDSIDPGDTYYAFAWDFARLYGRSLTTFKSAPGQEGSTIVPDLAESLGKVSADGKTWTYTLRKGMKYEDGTPITSKDVKYAVARSLDKDVLVNGPTYFGDFLDLQGYTSPFKLKDKAAGLKAIETPDDSTIIFHLNKPFAGFDYMTAMPSTIPVPADKDTGTEYKKHVISSGPYMFKDYEAGKSFTMVRNPNWDAASDPNRKALPDQIDVKVKQNQADIDNQLLAGTLDVDISGSGVSTESQGRILTDPKLKANADNPVGTRLWYISVNGDVAPLDNVECRRAIQYATDKTSLQRAYGGNTGGDIASNILPPTISGAKQFNLYPPGADNKGDLAKAKAALTSCGQPNGFTTTMAFRADRPKEKATAEAMQQALERVGIKLTLKGFPAGDYFKLYAGKPDYAKANNLGLMTNGWGADWPDGFGFISQIVDSRTIRPSGGNYNLSVKDPAVDALLDKAVLTQDKTARDALWVDVDKKVMEDATILPTGWAKGLYYRPANLTNVYFSPAYGMYDYANLGVTK
ncbi:MAG TPA: ABC transporter substrate-binding protein [Kineosporiaceae bacterium]|nr:ABC transporter substrate-binding protein [Kineosporiaceae bacterium]